MNQISSHSACLLHGSAYKTDITCHVRAREIGTTNDVPPPVQVTAVITCLPRFYDTFRQLWLNTLCGWLVGLVCIGRSQSGRRHMSDERAESWISAPKCADGDIICDGWWCQLGLFTWQPVAWLHAWVNSTQGSIQGGGQLGFVLPRPSGFRRFGLKLHYVFLPFWALWLVGYNLLCRLPRIKQGIQFTWQHKGRQEYQIWTFVIPSILWPLKRDANSPQTLALL